MSIKGTHRFETLELTQNVAIRRSGRKRYLNVIDTLLSLIVKERDVHDVARLHVVPRAAKIFVEQIGSLPVGYGGECEKILVSHIAAYGVGAREWIVQVFAFVEVNVAGIHTDALSDGLANIAVLPKRQHWNLPPFIFWGFNIPHRDGSLGVQLGAKHVVPAQAVNEGDGHHVGLDNNHISTVDVVV
jgi:hypothetical protein